MRVSITGLQPVQQQTISKEYLEEFVTPDKITSVKNTDTALTKIGNIIMTLIFLDCPDVLTRELISLKLNDKVIPLMSNIIYNIINESSTRITNELCNIVVDFLLAFIRMEFNNLNMEFDEYKVESILVNIINSTLFN